MRPCHDMPVTYARIASAMRDTSLEARSLVERAWFFADAAHHGQTQPMGGPFVEHPAAVALMLVEHGADTTTIVAALLHDVMNNGTVSASTIERLFGKDVRYIVEHLAKPSAVSSAAFTSVADNSCFAPDLRRLLLAAAGDSRVLVVKLYDRLHSLRVPLFANAEETCRKAKEALEVYVPIADRLGMGLLKRELEDAAFALAYPAKYEQSLSEWREPRMHSEQTVTRFKSELARELKAHGIEGVTIEIKTKNVYSFYKKLARKHGDISRVYDISTLRVIVPTVADCYRVLGVVHEVWRAVPKRTKDYIAFPKPNGYQSLHTTVYAEAATVGLRIRTPLMDTRAKYGIIAEPTVCLPVKNDRSEKKVSAGISMSLILAWLNSMHMARHSLVSAHPARDLKVDDTGRYPRLWLHDMLEACKQFSDPHEALASLSGDFFTPRMCVFTANNTPVYLPEGASALDYAYTVDAMLANRAVAAVVNGARMGLSYTLHNGDVVDMVTSQAARPVNAWLAYVHTARARVTITKALATA